MDRQSKGRRAGQPDRQTDRLTTFVYEKTCFKVKFYNDLNDGKPPKRFIFHSQYNADKKMYTNCSTYYSVLSLKDRKCTHAYSVHDVYLVFNTDTYSVTGLVPITGGVLCI